jgi:hypothetical protein
MKKILVLAAACTACLLLPFQSSAAAPADVTCSQDTYFFSGTARNLIVPDEGFCEISGATITHDLVVGEDAGADVSDTTIGHDAHLGRYAELDAATTAIGHDLAATGVNALHLERTTIAHNLVASQPVTVQTGRNSRDNPGGTVSIGHDLLIDGSPPDEDFVFDGMCALAVGHDMKVTNRAVTLGMGIGDNCAGKDLPDNTIANDLVVTGNTALAGFFGPSAIEVGNNHVGNDLVFKGNTAAPGGRLEVADNVVGRDAICASNDPAPSWDAGDGPNSAGRRNTCG